MIHLLHAIFWCFVVPWLLLVATDHVIETWPRWKPWPQWEPWPVRWARMVAELRAGVVICGVLLVVWVLLH
jgi:hypothetical protein